MLLVYKFGGGPPTAAADVVREQMRSAHHYHNALREIEIERRAASRAVEPKLTKFLSAVDEAEDAVVETLAVLNAQRASTRSASDTEEQRATVDAAKLQKKIAVAALNAQRKIACKKPSVIKARKAIWKKHMIRTQSVRAANGLHWGTGKLVDDAMKATSKMPLWDASEPNDPQFKRFTGEGHVGVQVHQKGAGKQGLTVAEVTSGIPGRWLQVVNRPAQERAPARTAKIAAHRARNAARRDASIASGGGNTSEIVELRIRIGTSEDGEPIVASWPMIMHRPLPAGAIVKRVAASMRRVGPREEWSFDFTIDASACAKIEPTGVGTVAVELGWLSVDGGLRAASTMDESGEMNANLMRVAANSTADKVRLATMMNPPLVLNAEHISGVRRAESLASTRKKNFNAALTGLIGWLREHGMPAWMRALTVKKGVKLPTQRQALAHLAKWESAGRLASLVLRWRSERHEGDDDGFLGTEYWRYHDYHLWAWESEQRKRMIRSRRDQYRVFAAQLAKKYARIVVSNANYKEIARKSKVRLGNDRAASNRQIAAVGELRSIIKQACAKYGAEFVKVDAAGLSTTCPACGSQDAAQQNVDKRTCACVNVKCARVRDVDSTALLNELRRAGCDSQVDAIIERGDKLAAMLHKDAAE
jgi:hypothetical protein